MVDTEKLNELISQSGLKKGFIAKELNISFSTFWRKCTNEFPFTAPEVNKLCKLLDINSLKLQKEIFFTDDVSE